MILQMIKGNSMKKTMLMLLVAVIISGCVSVGRKLDQDQVAKIKKGDTGQQVLALVGSPDQVTTVGNGDTTWSYTFTRATPTAVTFVPIVGAFAGGSDVQHQILVVTLDGDGVVKNIMSSYGSQSMGVGASSGGSAELKDTEDGKRPL